MVHRLLTQLDDVGGAAPSENDDGEANWGHWMERERPAFIATNDGPRSRDTLYNTIGHK